MNAIVPLNFDDQPVRILDREGQPWFVLADVCAILGLKNPTMAARPLDDTERSKIYLGGQGEAIVVSLPGMLTLVVRCRDAMKPGTIPYRMRKWITTDVVPTIMRTGSYGAPAPAIDLNNRIHLRALVEQLADTRMQDADRIAELEPQAEALARLAQTSGELCITDAAKALDVSPKRLFAWLEAHHWTYRRSEGAPWLAHERRRAAGFLKHKATTVPMRHGMPDRLVEQVMVTPKGLTRLAELKAGA